MGRNTLHIESVDKREDLNSALDQVSSPARLAAFCSRIIRPQASAQPL